MSRKRGNGARTVIPAALSRVERKAEAGFISFCKCPKGFKQWPLEKLRTMARGDTRRYRCRNCGHNKPEWRCPVHKLKAERLRAPGERQASAGCPRCGRAPKEQRFDAYMTTKAKIA